MNNRKLKKIVTLILIISAISVFGGCAPKEKSMILATTTSTRDSGLLDYLLPIFEKDTNIKVSVLAKGTGEAMELGKRGDADCLLVHAKKKEVEFVNEGYGVKRYDVMYNDFVIVGPKEDPQKLREKAPNSATEAFKLLASGASEFISRGDESGTHTKEKELWKAANVAPSGKWYVSAGKGMGDVLIMANEKKAYTLTDRATYLSMKDKLDLVVVSEKDKLLYNQYGVIKLNPQKVKIKEKEADEFINWMLSEKVQKLIGEFGKDKYGEALFIPNASK